MAQSLATKTLTLTCVPPNVDKLPTEPKIEDDFVPATGTLSPVGWNTTIGGDGGNALARGIGVGLMGNFFAPGIVPGIPSTIADIVRGARRGNTGIPAAELARLGLNSPDFYSAIGAVTGGLVSSATAIAALAKRVSHDFPTLWYVNFPHNMSAADAELVARHRESMLDFRSWSSKKWWEEVDRRYGRVDDTVARLSQSKEFAEIAFEDMVKMSWLRTTRPPHPDQYNFDCERYQLHTQMISWVLGGGWWTPSEDTARILEPIFESIVRGALAGSRNYSQMHNVVMEKYVYDESTKTIDSFIRLLSFELHEDCYEHVTEGKHGTRQYRVAVSLKLCMYEAVFDMAVWDKFSATLSDDDTDPLRDFVKSCTINVPEKR
ncbi:hypothetical protein B0J18DRAFT_300244 [Chaetomium sp. MPI-SDFR-AT-0129]|nr:hypothetical protein B0J18DRAFT_300244 [Chaetomium sp. MPI-SDFR-AT-0129]